jgi:hypothetical protein
MLKNPLFNKEDFGLDFKARVALSDSLHIMQQSAAVFKLMVRMLKTPTESQLLSFLRKLKKLLQGINPGEALMLPAYVEARELIILLERVSERQFKVVVIQTDPYGGLRHHTTSPAASMPHVTYRTCMVLNEVPKKNILDDVFWMALYNMAIHNHEGDTDRFYDVLIPFLTGKPLEASLVEAENAAAAALMAEMAPASGAKADSSANPEPVSGASDESKDEPAPAAGASKPATVDSFATTTDKAFTPENCGEWRLPQRSNTAYVRCTLEAFHFLLRRRQVSRFQAKQVHCDLRRSPHIVFTEWFLPCFADPPVPLQRDGSHDAERPALHAAQPERRPCMQSGHQGAQSHGGAGRRRGGDRSSQRDQVRSASLLAQLSS